MKLYNYEMIINPEKFDSALQKDKIACKCDYCGVEFERLKHNILRSWKHNKTDSCSGVVCVQKKRIETNQKVFGADNAFQNTDIKQKIIKTNLQKYGVDNPFKNKEVRKRQKATCQEKYGVDNVFASNDIKEKIKAGNVKKYGVENPMQNSDVKVKHQKTLIERYGVPHALQNDLLRQKAIDTCVSNHGHFPASNYGKIQNEIKDWLNSMGFNFQSNHTLVPGFEIDLYDADKKLAIEYCGLHWHHELSKEPRKRRYHWKKHMACLNQGVQLLTIFSDEWLSREKQCKSHIRSILGIGEKVFGRKCDIKEISKESGRDFIEEHHIQGKNHLGVVFYGLFHQEELLGVMSLGRHNRQISDIVLDRLCFRDGISVIGGASKLFSQCVKWARDNNYAKIISFSDNRWSLGRVYERMNFVMEKESGPDYSYVEIGRANKRISKQSQKKQTVNCPEELTEVAWANQRGLSRIWDCGKKRWIFNIEEDSND